MVKSHCHRARIGRAATAAAFFLAGTALSMALSQTASPTSPPHGWRNAAPTDTPPVSGTPRIETAHLDGPSYGALLIVAAGDAPVALGVHNIYQREVPGAPLGQPKRTEPVRDNDVHVYDLATGKEVRTLTGHTKEVSGIAISADGRIALSVGMDKTARAWDVASGKQIGQLDGSLSTTAIALSPKGDLAYFAHTGNTGSGPVHDTIVWSIATGETALVPEADVRVVAAPASLGRSSGGGAFAGPNTSADGKWTVRHFGLNGMMAPPTNTWEIRHADSDDVAYRVWFDGTGNTPEFLPDSASFEVRDNARWQLTRVHLPAAMPGTEHTLSPKTVLPWTEQRTRAGGARGSGGAPRIRDLLEISSSGDIALARGDVLYQKGVLHPLDLQKIDAAARDVHLAQDGKRLYSLGPRSVTAYRLDDLRATVLWSQPVTTSLPRGGNDPRRLVAFNSVRAVYLGEVAFVAEIPQAALNKEQRVVLWDILTNTRLSDTPLTAGRAAVAFSGDGRFMVTFDGASCTTFKTATGKVIQNVPLRAGAPFPQTLNPAMSLSDDGTIALISAGAVHRVFDLTTGAQLAEILLEQGTGPRPVLSRDGSRVLTVPETGDAYVFDTHAHAWTAHFIRAGAPLSAAAFDADGNILTLGTVPTQYQPITNELSLWTMPTPEEMGRVAYPVRVTTPELISGR